MAAVRAAVDKAEGLIEAALYPYPTYEAAGGPTREKKEEHGG